MENLTLAMLITTILGIIGVLTPVIKLNTSITKLNTTMENMQKQFCENEARLDLIDKRVYTHETQIKLLERAELKIYENELAIRKLGE